MLNGKKGKGKNLLTALNQASRERFTFEYGCCSSKDDFNRHKRERRGKALLQFTTRKSGKWKKSCTINKSKTSTITPHPLAFAQMDENTDRIAFTDREEQPSVTPLSLALSLSSTSTSLYSFSASKRMLPSLWKRKRRGKVMSSVLRPSPAI